MLKHSLFFEKERLGIISAYANRMNDERISGEVGYYHLMDSSLDLIKQSEDFIKDKSYIKNVLLIGMGGSSCGVKA